MNVKFVDRPLNKYKATHSLRQIRLARFTHRHTGSVYRR